MYVDAQNLVKRIASHRSQRVGEFYGRTLAMTSQPIEGKKNDLTPPLSPHFHHCNNSSRLPNLSLVSTILGGPTLRCPIMWCMFFVSFNVFLYVMMIIEGDLPTKLHGLHMITYFPFSRIRHAWLCYHV